MKRIYVGVVAVAGTFLLAAVVSYVLANEPKGEGLHDYSGVTRMEYTLIGLILAYGVYDSSLKKS
jgi:hypothetical protein